MADNFTFEEPLEGSWSVLNRVAANHEAAHAVMAVLLGIEIFEARIDRPIDRHPSTEGWVQHARPEEAWKAAALSVAPLILEKRLPSFPSLNSDDGDEFNAAVVIHDAGITPEQWAGIVELATDLLALPSSQRAITALSGALLERGALPGREIKELVDNEARPRSSVRLSKRSVGGEGLHGFPMIASELRQPVPGKKVSGHKRRARERSA